MKSIKRTRAVALPLAVIKRAGILIPCCFVVILLAICLMNLKRPPKKAPRDTPRHTAPPPVPPRPAPPGQRPKPRRHCVEQHSAADATASRLSHSAIRCARAQPGSRLPENQKPLDSGVGSQSH